MEAATPLQLSSVRARGSRLYIDNLVVDDECAATLVGEREAAGEDPARIVREAIEIGARIVAREQTAADTEYVRAEFERSARELEASFSERARVVSEQLGARLDESLSPETGHLQRALERHFSDDSSSAVQHRVKAVLDEVAARMREDLLRQFSSGDESNPLADFKNVSVATMRDASKRQHEALTAMTDKIAALELQIAGMRSDTERAAEVAAAEDAGTRKGRTYEEAVLDALEELAQARGDDCEGVGDVSAAGGKRGDVLVEIGAACGPAQGRIVFEAKNSKLSRKGALDELSEALAERDADYAVLVVRSEDQLPAKTQGLREFSGDKLFVVYDPDDGSRLALEVAYGLARARALTRHEAGGGVDSVAVRAEAEKALTAMEDVRRVKSQLTTASKGIDEARAIVEGMAETVRGHLAAIDALTTTA